MTVDQDLSKLPDFPPFSAWSPTENPNYLKILEEEKRKARLTGVDISLNVLEVTEGDEAYVEDCGLSGFARKEGDVYLIGLNEMPEIRGKTGHTVRNTIRHELAHIRNGDCDRYLAQRAYLDSLPKFLKPFYLWYIHAYENFVSEPRARRYARMN